MPSELNIQQVVRVNDFDLITSLSTVRMAYPQFHSQYHKAPSTTLSSLFTFTFPPADHPLPSSNIRSNSYRSAAIAASPLMPSASPTDSPAFDIFEWHPAYASCQRYFLEHAQHSAPVLALAAFTNILLPAQRHHSTSQSGATSSSTTPSSPSSSSASSPPSLIPYLRRLVVTGLDWSGVLHGFFGDAWRAGVGPLHEQERRNYLFAAKSGGWAAVKRQYDMGPLETLPFMRPLQGVTEVEVAAAEAGWSEWLAMEDWMVGPRAPRGNEMGMGIGTGLEMGMGMGNGSGSGSGPGNGRTDPINGGVRIKKEEGDGIVN